jgi:hypothetical protein
MHRRVRPSPATSSSLPAEVLNSTAAFAYLPFSLEAANAVWLTIWRRSVAFTVTGVASSGTGMGGKSVGFIASSLKCVLAPRTWSSRSSPASSDTASSDLAFATGCSRSASTRATPARST